MSQRIFTLITVALLNMTTPSFSAAQTSDQSPRWAIAIHGGAGGDPSKWNDDKRAGRQEGLRRALETGRDLLQNGASAMDAVEAVIRVLEDDARFNAGRGSVLTTEGNAELDASIMDGRDGSCGAVAGVTNTKNPISLARLVMSQTKHVLLTGAGANQFAVQQDVPLVRPDYFLSYRNRQHNREVTPLQSPPEEPHFGTVGCVALDSQGNLAAGTSTGGTTNKLAGRVGDSPIVGAGTYAANDTCGVSGTGIGEEYIRHSVAYDIAAQMRYAGRSIDQAVTEIMKSRLKPGVGGVIAVSRDGQIVLQHNTPGMSCGAADSNGRFDTYLDLPDGGTQSSPVDEKEIIRKLLNQQVRDWNEGRIDRFMDAYWQSEQLTFASGGGVTRGWEATLNRYRKRYPNQETMGQLTFSDLEFQPVGAEAMQVLGVWKLKRNNEPIDGRFTLIFRRLSEGWRIVHDHTSQRLP